VCAPFVVILLLSFVYKAYEKHQDLSYCSDRGVSDSQCSYFIEHGGY